VLTVVTVGMPILLVLKYAEGNFCGGNAEDIPPWCSGILPNVYSYIQKEYWDVGFMKYWQLKQIPNFILPFPILAICFISLYRLTKTSWKSILSFGVISTNSVNKDKILPFWYYLGVNCFILVFIANV